MSEKMNKTARTRLFILAHPDESIRHTAEILGVSARLVQNIREELVTHGELRPARNRRKPLAPGVFAPGVPTSPASADVETPRDDEPTEGTDHDITSHLEARLARACAPFLPAEAIPAFVDALIELVSQVAFEVAEERADEGSPAA